MSVFGGLILTNKGRNLLIKGQLGAVINYTRIAIGDGELSGSSMIDLTALKHEVKTLPLTKLKSLTGGRFVVGTTFSNNDITSGFYYRELGLFAQDPDLGEILYCYANAGTLAEYIAGGGGTDLIEKAIDIEIIVGNASSVTATIDSSLVYATYTDLGNKVDKVTGKQLSTEDYTTIEKSKLAGVASGANNYSHPSTHPPTIIDQDANNRFVTDSEKISWDSKETSSGAQAKVIAHEEKTDPHAQYAKDDDLTNFQNSVATSLAETAAQVEGISTRIEKVALYNSTCTYASSVYTLVVANAPTTLPSLFSIRFKVPNNYVSGATFKIGTKIYTAKNANFETADVVTVEFDEVSSKCFFKSGGVNDTLPQQIENLNATIGNVKIDLTWTIPNTSYLDGFVFTYKANGIPTNPNDGVKVTVAKTATSLSITGLTNGTLYYVRAFPYNTKNQYQTEYKITQGTPLASKLLSELPIGSYIKFGNYQVENEVLQPILWQIADKNHSGYPTNSVTLITYRIIDMRGYDAAEPSNANTDRVNNGNNRYNTSNLRQWLNSTGLANSWWVVKNLADGVSNTNNQDAIPNDAGFPYLCGYNTKQGFLKYFNASEQSNILPTTLTVAKNTITDGGGSETVVDNIFLPSATEVGLANENNIIEGAKYPLFITDVDRVSYLTQQAFTNTRATNKPSNVNTAHYWRLRTPNSSKANITRAVQAIGALTDSTAVAVSGIRPVTNLKSNILMSPSVDADGCYTMI